MDISRNKFSNSICVIFSVVLVGLFCVFISSRLGLDNIVSCAIIAAVLCGIVACLIFFLNRLINRFSQGKSFNGKLIYNIAIVMVSLIFVAIRLLMISNVIDIPMVLGQNYDNILACDKRFYINFSSTEGIISTIISVFMGLLGNSYFPIILVQMLLNVLSFVLIVFGIKDLMGRMASVAVGAGIAISPVFYKPIASDGVENIILLAFAIIVFVSSKYKKSMDEYQVKWYFSFIIGLMLGFFGLYNKSLMFLPIIPLIVLWDCNSESTSTKAGNSFVMILGAIITFWVPVIVDCFVFSNTGIDGFLAEITNIFGNRFSFAIHLKNIEQFVSIPWVLIVLLFCLAYCVLFWKNGDDSGHIMGAFAILVLAQMFFTSIGGTGIYNMLVLVAVLAIAGYSFINLGYDPEASDVYRIEDDMQPAVVQAIGNKVVASDEEIQNIFAENEIKASALANENKAEEIVSEVEENITVTEEDNNVLETVKEETKESSISIFDGSFSSDSVSDNSEEVASTTDDYLYATDDSFYSDESVDASVNVESKYTEPEERKTDDFGMKDADFASLFSGNVIPPKFARNDYYELDMEEEKEAEVEEPEVKEVEEQLEVIENVDENVASAEDDSKDKKAYVDTFFSYLYDESVFEQPIEAPKEEEPVEEVYVSNAAKFADLDLDLGVDAFDNVLVEETVTEEIAEEITEDHIKEIVTENSEEPAVEETVFEEPAVVETVFEEPVTEEAFFEEPAVEETVFEEPIAEEEYSFDNSLVELEKQLNIEEEFNFNEETYSKESTDYFKDNNWDDIKTDNLEKSLDEYSQSVEAEVYKALADFSVEKEEISVEEAIERKIREEDGFSYEEAISRRLEDEAIKEEMGFSLEEALEKKLDVEDSIKEAESKITFSYEDVLAQKIALEETLQTIDDESSISAEDLLSKKFEVEEALNNSKLDDAFSIQEALEQKLDVEKEIDIAVNKPILDVLDEYDNVDRELSLNSNNFEQFNFIDSPNETNLSDEVGTISDEMVFDEGIADTSAEETIQDEFVFEPVEDNSISRSGFSSESEAIQDELVFDSVEENETIQYEFVPESEVVHDELVFDTADAVTTSEDEYEPVNETIQDEFEFVPVEENIEQPYDYIPASETVKENVEEFVENTVEESAKNVLEETSEPVEFIENPLPLPKKHVHREMDYGRSIPLNWMHYDVEVNSKNNFFDI